MFVFPFEQHFTAVFLKWLWHFWTFFVSFSSWKGLLLPCGVSDIYVPQAYCLKNTNCGANWPFWCQNLWHCDPQIGADMQTPTAKTIAALRIDFKTGLDFCLLVPSRAGKSVDCCAFDTDNYLFLKFQSFQLLSTFQSAICFCKDCQRTKAVKSLGLSCSHLA